MSSVETITASTEAWPWSVGSMDWLATRKREHDLAETQQKQQARPEDMTTSTSSTESKTQTSTPSKFLSLPPELRNEIYTALFPPSSEGSVQRIKPGYELPGLLLTCKQIHSECMGLYYSNSIFRCLDEDSAVSWLTNLPPKWLDMIEEVRYDTRWIIFMTPFIPVPEAECWLFQNLIKRLNARGFDINGLGTRVGPDGVELGDGKLKVSFYGSGGVKWTDKPGLIDPVRGA
ncbi:hypothetical protein M409DRAFT_26947 [Zasmidium cellare ATCC 36951]|uniref:F-box domain-containing protein n=1 Tax=Zasmidium cellare ATCC 36951 TaxID=1080233 RepID=A0A6A6C901_ZASCE|nr:uncharacterized protein M409DRAFT_26947 [Zasmidium cellare ATCC 36951]KAF2162710.1 hypothetical protein M409DRAFT_26947 [Zasmidium cellare ATCC 36951]